MVKRQNPMYRAMVRETHRHAAIVLMALAGVAPLINVSLALRSSLPTMAATTLMSYP